MGLQPPSGAAVGGCRTPLPHDQGQLQTTRSPATELHREKSSGPRRGLQKLVWEGHGLALGGTHGENHLNKSLSIANPAGRRCSGLTGHGTGKCCWQSPAGQAASPLCSSVARLLLMAPCSTVQQQLRYQCVINIILILNPKHDTIPATRKKINSSPDKTRT